VRTKSLTKPEIARLMGKRVRIWRSKKRGVGETVEGICKQDCGHFTTFVEPTCEQPLWVVTATRVLDVFEDGKWVPMFPRGDA
jgi:hypothetical protein